MPAAKLKTPNWTKICSCKKCQKEYKTPELTGLFEFFYPSRHWSDGFYPRCKTCVKSGYVRKTPKRIDATALGLKTLEELKMQIIFRRLGTFQNNRLQTAKSLDISVKGLRNWIKILRKKGFDIEDKTNQPKGKSVSK